MREHEKGLAAAKSENERLKQRLSEVQTQDFIEGEIRNKLGLVKPGETVVLMGGAQHTVSSDNVKSDMEQLHNWKQWWNLFF